MSKTMEKGLQLLDLFTEEKHSWTLDEISTHAEMPKPTAYRMLRSLVNVGFLQRTLLEKNGKIIESDNYVLGLKLLQLGGRVASALEIREIAFPYMKQLQSEINEAVQLVTRDNENGIYIEKVESTRPVRLYTRIGRQAPLYAGACTRTLLSYLPDDEITEILKNPIKNYASHTPKTVEDVWALIHKTRQEGFAYSHSELEEGTVSIATPIFNHRGEVQYSISIAGFPVSLPIENVKKFVVPLWKVASIISKKLGYNDPYPYGDNITKIS
ncbi:IclR family transcriptional regulator [Sporosarcina limicola]|uniref:DNA-binding IclR family transcriptional regulator n=1 Tax=Sporosarcina limicola TaxID=34101 RepID=A0A927MJT9_9BACL|nr:IclR family transcriptional regulator [Sporosarcina limicola]MBE1556039.1 DNA-binding IclR family transcriptional regulator [Sporosarcina limicola]